jgi:hypothetical protein
VLRDPPVGTLALALALPMRACWGLSIGQRVRGARGRVGFGSPWELDDDGPPPDRGQTCVIHSPPPPRSYLVASWASSSTRSRFTSWRPLSHA